MDFGGGKGKGEGEVTSSPAEPGSQVLGICGPELRVLPNREGQGVGLGLEEAAVGKENDLGRKVGNRAWSWSVVRGWDRT